MASDIIENNYRRTIRRIVLTALLVLQASWCWGQAKTRITLGVMDLIANGLSAEEGRILTETLLTHLVNSGAFEVVERSRRDEILREQGFQQSGVCDDASCLVEIGKYLAVQKMVGGSVGRFGRTWMVNIRLLDVQTGKVEKAVAKSYQGEMDVLLNAMQQAAEDISGQAVQAPAAQSSPLPQLKHGIEYYNQGRQLMAQGNFTEALRYFQEAVRLDPQHALYLTARGYAFLHSGDLEAAQSDFQKAAVIRPKYDWAHIGQGDVLYQKKEYASAIAVYRKALDLGGDQAELYRRLCDAYFGLQEYDRALEQIEKLIKEQKKNHQAWYRRGLAYFYLGDYARALASYQQALALDPGNPLYYLGRGQVHYRRQDYAAALEDFSKAVLLKSDYLAALDWRAMAQCRLKKFSEALADMDKALAQNPNQPELYRIRGRIYLDMDQYHRALSDFSRAVELAPQVEEYRYRRAEALSLKGEYRQASAVYDSLVAAHPNSARPYRERSVFALLWARYLPAVEDATRALQMDPDNLVSLNDRAVAWFMAGDNAKALADCERIIELTGEVKDPARYFSALGLKQQCLGRWAKALEYYQKALALMPDWAGLYSRRGDVYNYLGKRKEALADWRKSYELNRFYPLGDEARKAIGLNPIKPGN